MAISRQKKEEIINRVTEILKQSPAVVFVNFHGLPVAGEREMRKSFRDKNVGYYVAKKTLVKKAISCNSIDGEMPEIEGELALAYSDNPVAAAGGVHEFSKKSGSAVSILGGIFNGSYMSKESMEEIALIPPLDVLYGQILHIISSPIQGIAIALDKIAQSREG